MKNPQNYKQYYKTFNTLRSQIIKDILDKLFPLDCKSIAFAEGFLSICTLQFIEDDKSVIAMGLTLSEDFKITVHGGVYDPDTKYDIETLNMNTLLRLYKVFEEAYYEYPHESFIEYRKPHHLPERTQIWSFFCACPAPRARVF